MDFTGRLLSTAGCVLSPGWTGMRLKMGSHLSLAPDFDADSSLMVSSPCSSPKPHSLPDRRVDLQMLMLMSDCCSGSSFITLPLDLERCLHLQMSHSVACLSGQKELATLKMLWALRVKPCITLLLMLMILNSKGQLVICNKAQRIKVLVTCSVWKACWQEAF